MLGLELNMYGFIRNKIIYLCKLFTLNVLLYKSSKSKYSYKLFIYLSILENPKIYLLILLFSIFVEDIHPILYLSNADIDDTKYQLSVFRGS